MKSLWFKQKFVEPILTGAKTDTVRRPSARLPKEGDTVMFQVGPKPPFATALITRVQEIGIDHLSEAHKRDVLACFPCDDTVPLVRIEFTVLPSNSDTIKEVHNG